jgi:hypothetical protein
VQTHFVCIEPLNNTIIKHIFLAVVLYSNPIPLAALWHTVLQGFKSGNALMAGGNGVVANSTQLEQVISLGRWHNIRLSAMPGATSSNRTADTCSGWVDGVLVAKKEGCSLAKLFDYCVTSGTLKIEFGSFDG